MPTMLLNGLTATNKLLPKSISVVLDGAVVMREEPGNDICLAMSSLMTAYFVYGVQYAQKLRNTMLFFECFVFGLSDKEAPVGIKRRADVFSTKILRFLYISDYEISD